MLLVQDQYTQNSRKNFDSEFQLKQNTSKQVFPDPKEVWEIESGCEEGVTSGNDSEADDNVLYEDPSDIPEDLFEARGQASGRKKNVRFGDHFGYVFDTSETSSLDNEYLGADREYLGTTCRKPLTHEPEMSGWKGKVDHYRGAHRTKWRNLDYGYEKARPKSSPEKIPAAADPGLERRQMNLGEYDSYRTRRKEHCCGRYHDGDFEDLAYRKPSGKYKFECEDDAAPRCCDHCLEKKNHAKGKSMTTPSYKHVCHPKEEPEMKNHRKQRLDPQPPPYHAFTERYCQDEYYDLGYPSKTKKKALEAVQEQQEQFSDSTYKVPCMKYSSQTIPGELSDFPRKKSAEKLTNSFMSDWLCYGGKGTSLGPPRVHKMRSRRTRMNKIKNGWKRALVQTVRDGSRNERIGVIVMGSKGPEFYAKNSKPGFVPFRKSKSFLDGAAKSFEVMTVDCKNVFLSSSEPGPRTNHAIADLACPEEDVKMEEKIARFSKNVNDIVKHSEEKFYKALSSSEYQGKKNPGEGIFVGAGEGIQEEQPEKKDEKPKFPNFSLFPFNSMSPRVPKSLRKTEKKMSLDSKVMADALNEQAKQYKENQSSLKDKEESFLEGLKELKEKYSPKEITQEAIEDNTTPWGMKLEVKKCEMQEESNKEEDKKGEDVEKKSTARSTTRSVDQVSGRQQQKSHLELAGEEKVEELVVDTPEMSRRVKKLEFPKPSRKNSESADSNLISAVFRDLVENGCAISREESENLQSIFNQVSQVPEVCSNEVASSSVSSSDLIKTMREEKINPTPRSLRTPTSLGDVEDYKKKEKEDKGNHRGHSKRKTDNEEKRKCREIEELLEEINRKKTGKMKTGSEEKLFSPRTGKKMQGKQKKTSTLEDRMQLLRQALPSIAAENEAAHLKQLKKYIDKFIGRVEANTSSEFSKRKELRRRGKSGSTDSSEVRVDACKILDFVSNPFKKISSEVTINIAKKLTDTLVQDRSTKGPRPLPAKPRKQSENETDDEGFAPCNASSGSERCEEPEPTYLKQLKKMRNEHLNNILVEVKRLSELLRFLDRCNRLHF